MKQCRGRNRLLVFSIAVTKALLTNNFSLVDYGDRHPWNLTVFHLCGDHIIDVITERCGCVSASSGESLPLFSTSFTTRSWVRS